MNDKRYDKNKTREECKPHSLSSVETKLFDHIYIHSVVSNTRKRFALMKSKTKIKRQKVEQAPIELQIAATISILEQRFLVIKQAILGKKRGVN